jgi:NADPH:quinone reductase-like Zn-dependent oxidoreductase
MKAWQINNYGKADVLQIKELPDPTPRKGWVLVRIKAFGINRSELYTRQGHSGEAVQLPRILGIECVGEVIDGGETGLQRGQKVAAAMGNMGRLHDGGYAEMALLPRPYVYPFESSLSWEILGALPEMYLTAWGAVRAAGLKKGGHLLVRGGTSSVGLACVSIAKKMGCTVWSTTRSQAKAAVLEQAGVDRVLIDDGVVENLIKETHSPGVDAVVELVGMQHTIMDSLRSCAPFATVCMVGFLGNQWDYNFFPWMPSTVKLTIYSSETLEQEQATRDLQHIIHSVEQGLYLPHIHRVFAFDELQDAHRLMESNGAAGKLVVLTDTP